MCFFVPGFGWLFPPREEPPMTGDPGDEHREPDPEWVRVTCWREIMLLHAGYAPQHAAILALLTDVDLHMACDIVARGCPEDLAFTILS